MLGGSQSSSSSQESTGFASSITGTLRYIGEAIAQYTGLSQSPPSSQDVVQQAQEPEEIFEMLASVASEAEVVPEEILRHAEEQRVQHGLKVRDYAYKNPLPPLPVCECHKDVNASFPIQSLLSPRPQVMPAVNTPVNSRKRKHQRSLGLTKFSFMPPEAFKAAFDSGDSPSSDDSRPAKRPKKLEREDTEPLLSSQSQPPSHGPGFGAVNTGRPPPGSPENNVMWRTLRRGDSFTPVVGPSRIARNNMWENRVPERTPREPQWMQDLRGVEMQYDQMEGIIPTPVVTPQGSQVFSDWSGFSSRSSIASTERADSPGPDFAPSKLSTTPSLGDFSQIIVRHNTPLVINSRSAILRPLSAASSERTIVDSTDKPSSMIGIETPPVTQAGPSTPQTPYQLRPRTNNSSAFMPPKAPRKSTAGFTSNRSISPSLSLTFARRNKNTTAGKATSKTRSTLSKQAAEKSLTHVKPAVRRSPRTKTAAARTLLSSVLVGPAPVRSCRSLKK